MVHGVIHLILNPSSELANEYNRQAEAEGQRIESYCRAKGIAPDIAQALKDLRTMHRANEFHFDLRTPDDRLAAIAEDPNNDEWYRVNQEGVKHPERFAPLIRMAGDRGYRAIVEALYRDEIVPALKAEE